MDLSCALLPGPDAVRDAQLAEDLGYRRVWVFDSPALFADVWVTLARIAENTRRVGVGPAVLVPSLRHVVTQAAAIVTLEQSAPGRVVAAIGTGFTGRLALGRRPLAWARVETYLRQLRGLLHGETVEVDGHPVRLLHPVGAGPAFPVLTPLLVAANGPKGLAVARELGDGVMSVGQPQGGFDWSALLAFGTVLEEGESLMSPRALAAAGPAVTAAVHGMYVAGGAVVDSLPGGKEWRALLEDIPERERHLALHEDHLLRVTDRDRGLLDAEMIRTLTWSGPPAVVARHIREAEQAGATEVLYAPLGPDIGRELRTFAAAAQA